MLSDQMHVFDFQKWIPLSLSQPFLQRVRTLAETKLNSRDHNVSDNLKNISTDTIGVNWFISIHYQYEK